MLRMDNLSRAVHSSFQKEHHDPFLRGYPVPLAIPNTPKMWPESTGMDGRIEPESLAAFNWKIHKD
jgi:hypothetical protein